MSETTTKYHECEDLQNFDVISVQKIKGKWYWIYWSENAKAIGSEVRFCPYCGKALEMDK